MKNNNIIQSLPATSYHSITKSIRDLMELDIELKPFYQREDVWDNKYKKNLIYSIINGIPINTFHLVKENLDNGGVKYTALDGKQRLTALNDFIKKDLEIEYSFKTSKEPEKITFKRLENLKNSGDERGPEAKKLLQAINTYTTNIIEWNELNLLTQSQVFNTINYSKELSKEERLLSQYFYAKVFASFLISKFQSFVKLAKYGVTGRGTKEIYILKLFYLLSPDGCGFMTTNQFDPQLSNIKNIKHGSKGNFPTFIEQLNGKIANYVESNKSNFSKSFDHSDEMQKMIVNFKWNKIDEYAKILNNIETDMFNDLGDKNTSRDISPWLLTRFGLFLLEKRESGVLTHHSYIANIKNLKQIMLDLIQCIKQNNSLTRRALHRDICQEYETKFNNLFNKYIINTDIKNKAITGADKLEALLKSDGTCPICSRILTKNNTHIDHIDPKALYGAGKAQLLCDVCNVNKGANTLESVLKIQQNIEQNF